MHIKVISYAALLLQVIETGEVSVRSFDRDGRANTVAVREFRDEQGIDHAAEFRSGQSGRLRYGMYRYRIQAGRNERAGFVVLREPQRLLVLFGEPRIVNHKTGVELELISEPPVSIIGKCRTCKSNDGNWVRVQSVHDTTRLRDALIDDEGAFTIPAGPSGKCFLILFRGGNPLSVSLIDLPTHGNVRLDVGDDSQQPTNKVRQ